MHLANNLYGLLFASIFLLPIVGNARLILFYLLIWNDRSSEEGIDPIPL